MFGGRIGVLHKAAVVTAKAAHSDILIKSSVNTYRKICTTVVSNRKSCSFTRNQSLSHRHQFRQLASTVNDNDYDIDLITLAKKEKSKKITKSNNFPSKHIKKAQPTPNSSQKNDSSMSTAKDEPPIVNFKYTDFKAPMGYKYFSTKFAEEMKILLSYLIKIDFGRKILATNKVDIENTFRNFKLRFQFGNSKHDSEVALSSISLMLTGFKRNPELFEYFVFSRLGLDIRPSSPSSASVPTEAVPTESLKAEEVFHTDSQSIEDGSSKLGSLLHHKNESPPIPAPKNVTEELYQKKSFKDLIMMISKNYENLNIDDKNKTVSYKTTKVELNSSLDKAIKEKKNNYTSKSKKNLTISNIENLLGTAKMTHDARKDSLFKAEKAFSYSRSMLTEKSFADGNFFTPVCIPNTLIPTSLFNSSPSGRAKMLEHTPLHSNHQSEFCVLLSTGEVIKSKKNPIGNFFVPEDIFTIFSKLDKPELYTKKVKYLQKKGWKLIGGGDNRQMLVFERHFPARHIWVYEKMKTLFALLGLFFVCMIIFYSYSRREFKSMTSKKEETKTRE